MYIQMGWELQSIEEGIHGQIEYTAVGLLNEKIYIHTFFSHYCNYFCYLPTTMKFILYLLSLTYGHKSRVPNEDENHCTIYTTIRLVLFKAKYLKYPVRIDVITVVIVLMISNHSVPKVIFLSHNESYRFPPSYWR